MVDPFTLGVLGAAAGAAPRLSDVGAERLVLRGRTALVRAPRPSCRPAARSAVSVAIAAAGWCGSRT